jgi:murein tripeptide amidase MpaA
VNNYEENKDLVDAYDWYILPVHNPDGYEYSHTDVNTRLPMPKRGLNYE